MFPLLPIFIVCSDLGPLPGVNGSGTKQSIVLWKCQCLYELCEHVPAAWEAPAFQNVLFSCALGIGAAQTVLHATTCTDELYD